jgi:uncharacterized protein YdeI (YjbR/CyaY-like superfamily)
MMNMELKDGIKTFYAKTQKDWRKWLDKNHASEKSVWLIMYKKESGVPSVYYPEAVDEALCFGWIDSKPNKRDDESFYQFFSKRNPKSNWSKVNKDKVAKLLAQKLIMPAGLESIEVAKKNGTWTALDEVENITIPEDLQLRFDKNKTAYKHWEAFPRSTKKGILEWILNAKKPETRLKRIDETIELAAKNIRANQYKPS